MFKARTSAIGKPKAPPQPQTWTSQGREGNSDTKGKGRADDGFQEGHVVDSPMTQQDQGVEMNTSTVDVKSTLRTHNTHVIVSRTTTEI